jgi:hypothetical protein
MDFRKLSLTAAALAVFAPVIGNASPETEALNACARALATSLAAPGAAAPGFRVSYRSNLYSGSMLDFYTHAYTFELHANDQKTGLPIARASCSTDRRGDVVSLSPIPLDAVRPTLAAQL